VVFVYRMLLGVYVRVKPMKSAAMTDVMGRVAVGVDPDDELDLAF
jgi:hypothetical protein